MKKKLLDLLAKKRGIVDRMRQADAAGDQTAFDAALAENTAVDAEIARVKAIMEAEENVPAEPEGVPTSGTDPPAAEPVNSRDNQMMLVASLNSSYFRQLMQQSILDPDYANAASIDVDAQRAAWVASGKSEAADWDDDTVKANPFKRTVYLTANVKILGSMTDLIFPVTMA